MKRVLVLDRDIAIAELIRVVLEEAGFAISTATDPNELPGGPVDCIVTDLMDLTLYSREEARAWILRLQGRYANVPIVVVSAHKEAAGDQAALGVRQVIMKPFDVDLIPAAVRAITS